MLGCKTVSPVGYDINAADCSCCTGCSSKAVPSLLNLYSYVNNDPLNSQDPLGENAIIYADAAFLAALVTLAALYAALAALEAARKIKEELDKCTPPRIPEIEIPQIPGLIPMIGTGLGILTMGQTAKDAEQDKLKEIAKNLGVAVDKLSEALHKIKQKKNQKGKAVNIDENGDVTTKEASNGFPAGSYLGNVLNQGGFQ